MRPSRHPLFCSRSLVLAMAVGLAAPLAGCASSQSRSQTAVQLTGEEMRLFDGGVDFIAQPEGLAGRWREDWLSDLHTRVQKADAIAAVTVRTLRTDIAPDQIVTHRLQAHVDRLIHGNLDGSEFELTVRQGAPGFSSVDQASARLPSQSFLAFVKRGRDESGEAVLHFHLAPASDSVIGETEAAIVSNDPRKAKQAPEHTIVHTH